ncbi:hypothetical protein GXP71_01265 [Cellulomonas sp. H30R-01]|jgi:hypothetical protein|uniref:hypothetical protein n=1 Tax=Cellulomonas sp. H30R-01 TaxID=2704467 RepID=UPI00138C70D9|nr:hypothetical protein [Cellulomonas sp. H30R-01]QHT54861.1 hypothetical protein GXP71_01265 [Cellulomonas sp. H30R-01]
MSARWVRTHEAFGARDALGAVDRGMPWVILWCEGGLSRSTDDPPDHAGVSYVRGHLVEPAERERLFRKAQRKGRTSTVVMAERWESPDEGPLIVFYESGPYLLPDRDDPTTV